MMTKRVNFISKLSNLYAERRLADFILIQVVHVRVPAYISTIISAAADEGPVSLRVCTIG